MSAVYFKRASYEKTAFKFSWLNFFIAIERGVGVALMFYFVCCVIAGYSLKHDAIKRDIELAKLEKQKLSCEIKKHKRRR